MTKDEIFEEMKRHLVELFEVPAESVTMEAKLGEDLDLDSIDAVDLILKIQELTKVRIDPETFKSVRTVGDVVERVHEMLAESA